MNQNLIKYIKIVAAVITIAIAAQVTFDVGSIPITGQTLAILAWAFFLSYQESLIALSLYLILGFIGAPVFADGASSIEKLYGGSGGYLIGFLVAAGFISYLYTQLKFSSFLRILGLTALGTLIILFFGVSRLIMMYGFDKGIEYGLAPFWQGALIKIIIGSILVWSIKGFLLKSKTPP